MYAAENLQFMHSAYTYAYIHTYIYIHTEYINKFSRTVPFKVYISGCMNSYFNAHNEHHIHAYIPNYLPNPHIRSPGLGAATAATAGVSVSVIAWHLLVHTDIHFKFNSISDD